MRDPFPGNIIPQSRIDPVIKNYLSHNPWKQPTDPDRSAQRDLQITWWYRARAGITSPDTTRKIDHQFNSNNGSTGAYSRSGNEYRDGSSRHTSWRGLCWTPSMSTPLDMTNIAVADTHYVQPDLDQ